jgi:RNA polymerase sigma-70 factor (ECF subfamily)
MIPPAPADGPEASPARGGAFPVTQWSVIVRAGGPGTAQARSALEHLCRQYWFPLYAFVRRQGRPHHEAEDCTQEFLARLLAQEGVGRARPEQGRFRSYLLTALRNFLTNEWHRARAEKRGGGRAPLPLEFETAERTYSREPADPALTPEQAYDRTWALGLIERSVAALREDYEKSGRGALFNELAPLVWGDGAAETLSVPAARLGLTTHAFTVALHRLRQRLGRRLRADVAETVATDAEVDEELRQLIAAVSARPATR